MVDLLKKQLTSPVLWEPSVQKMLEALVPIGPLGFLVCVCILLHVAMAGIHGTGGCLGQLFVLQELLQAFVEALLLMAYVHHVSFFRN